MKRFLKDYLSFSRKERKAMIILLLLIIVCFVAPYFYPVKKTVPVVSKELLQFADQQRKAAPSAAYDYPGDTAFIKPGLDLPKPGFAFDPNTIDEQGWKKLGLREGLIKTIMRYRTRGGQFRQPDDLSKIWGMSAADAARLKPYVRIVSAVPGRTPLTTGYFASRKKITQIHINTATAEEWESLPGIGKILAGRIIAFRDKLGGFVTVQQVGQTYGLRDSVFERIKPLLVLDPSTGPVSAKIQLNRVSVSVLVRQLYLSMPLARAIIVFRKAYGNFTSVEDLKKIPILPDSVYQRIAPMLTIE